MEPLYKIKTNVQTRFLFIYSYDELLHFLIFGRPMVLYIKCEEEHEPFLAWAMGESARLRKNTLVVDYNKCDFRFSVRAVAEIPRRFLSAPPRPLPSSTYQPSTADAVQKQLKTVKK